MRFRSGQRKGRRFSMMKLTTPKNGNDKLFYVSSEANPNSEKDKHIVIRYGTLFFCDCRNFMIERLTKLGSADFSLCKHGEFVLDTLAALSSPVQIIQAIPNKKCN